MIPTSLKRAVQIAAAGGAIAMATVLIKHHEGIRYVPYADPGNGTLTVCYGHTGPDIVPGKRYSQAECDELLKKDTAIAAQAVDRLVKVPVSKYQRAALIDFAYNVGPGNLAKSTLLRKLNAGDRAGACQEISRWNRAGGRILKGLTTRREIERALCEGELK